MNDGANNLDLSTKWLMGMVGLMALSPVIGWLLPVALDEVNPALHKTYLLFHILGAVLFLGNIIVTGVWMLLAERSGSVPVVRFAARVVNWMDVYLTAPASVLLIAFGVTLTRAHDAFTAGWLVVGVALFGLSGLIWLVRLIPDQQRMITLSESATDKLPAEFTPILHRWYVWGAIATILPLITLALMVRQPTLW